MHRTVAVLACALALTTVASAQSRDTTQVSGARVTLTPGAKYKAGTLKRLVLGQDYRALWTTPIEVNVIDLRRTAGGLTPTQRGGSMQTNSLRFTGGDGREYVFRPSEKDFTKGLPEELRETIVRDVAQDQVAGYHPAAAVVVSGLLDATGLRHPRPQLVVLPDDALLGEFRAEFAGVLGTFEERPARDFDESAETLGATDVISSERLFERLRRSSTNQVDTRAYLAARLFDVLVGDRDRHRDQWRWGRFSTRRGALWEPIPRDRDMPFARFEGLGPWVIRGFVPQLISFGEDYPSMVWLNWNAREIDRRLLSGLDMAVWDTVALNLQLQLNDDVLRSSIGQMPPAWVAIDGQRLFDALVARRALLPEAAREFYRVLASEVNLEATDDADVVDVSREADGATVVSIASSDSSGRPGRPWLQRRFVKGETREVRLFLQGGNDVVNIHGPPSSGVKVRVIGGAGDDVVADAVSGGDRATSVHDSEGTNEVRGTSRASIDRRAYAPPATDRAERQVRDWGNWSFTTRGVSAAPGIGVLASLSHTRFAYGFRHDPFKARHVFRADVSLSERRPRVRWDGTFPRSNSQDVIGMRVIASGIELIRFHGLGNETRADSTREFFRVFQNLFRVEPTWTRPVAPGVTMEFRAVGQFTSTRDNAGTLLSRTAPYGSEEFGEVGAGVGIVVDRRDSPVHPTKGFRLALGTTVFPAVWSVEETFAEANATASTYLHAGGPKAPTLA
ncbi:MAG: hypothetical protein H7066_07580, partial [Cytophagaceae bacterium]|nr:hypothetical protein [Gemmatimonadaceae bacterium]